MRHPTIRHMAGLCFVAGVLTALPVVQASLTVHSGWDLLATVPDSQDHATGTYWQGVPLNYYDFGGSIGSQWVGMTDTIVHRTADATAPSYDTWIYDVPVTIDALQLRSVDQVNLGAGLGYYYVTLDSGHASGGTMDIYFGPEGDPHGTWTSSMNLWFDIRYGSLSGPVVLSTSDVISPGSVPWRQENKGDALLIAGVNYALDGTDIFEDFWPGTLGLGIPGTPCETHHVYKFEENGVIIYHDVVTTCPEPSTCILALSGFAAFGLGSLRGRWGRLQAMVADSMTRTHPQ